jgi:16S rRNA (cytidine1402-2'-O)-methyltransferase
LPGGDCKGAISSRSVRCRDRVALAVSSLGSLVLVATPIGNLGDLSQRAVETLAHADLICCEDTRRTRKLLTHAGVVGRRLMSLHVHNERSRVEQIIRRVAAGDVVAVVSDAGTPSISDPGGRIVAAAIAAGVRVSAVPGPNAAITALALSGLKTDRFCFEGFLPRKGTDRKARLAVLAEEERTILIYEAPSRLVSTLSDLSSACGPDRAVAVARELTKVHEELWRGSLGEATEAFASREVHGEVVVVLDGARPPREPEEQELVSALRESMDRGESARDAARTVSEKLGVGHRRAYQLALSVRNEDPSENAVEDDGG